jgi:hypothetical protein
MIGVLGGSGGALDDEGGPLSSCQYEEAILGAQGPPLLSTGVPPLLPLALLPSERFFRGGSVEYDCEVLEGAVVPLVPFPEFEKGA